MNKSDLVNTLTKETTYDETTCEVINDIIEGHLIIGKNNKRKIKREITERLQVDNTEADNIYNKVMEILTREIKNKLKHPLN